MASLQLLPQLRGLSESHAEVSSQPAVTGSASRLGTHQTRVLQRKQDLPSISSSTVTDHVLDTARVQEGVGATSSLYAR